MHWMLMPYRRYAEFSGRSRRMEYWMFTLFTMIVAIIGYILMLSGGGADFLMAAGAGDPLDPASPMPSEVSFGPLFWVGALGLLIFELASIIPSIALTIRRLHDRNMTGWYLLGFIVVVIALNVIPVIGPALVLLLSIGWIVLMALPGTRGPNKYGPDPLGQADPEVFA